MATPLHARLSAELRERILRGDFRPGEPLPSEAQLREEFGTSRGTVRAALATLRHAGLIGGGQGRPPVVRDTTLSQPFENLMSFSSWAERAGRRPGQHTLEISRRAASAAAANALGIDAGATCVDYLRVRSLDDEPVMLERSTWILDVGRLLFDFDIDAGSVYGHLLDSGVDLQTARHTMDAVPADETDAAALGVEVGAPLLRERRVARASDGTAIEYGDDRYRSDRVTFTFDNSRPTSVGLAHDLRILKEPS
ncbi:MAG: GntR family transcriptional regulator [Nocardioidaceae bacterium]|nr:GntR family transcriptional regulator [Nocardioidaceae bacterium]MCL2613488.1 GntR family transcriptional regulator [Nocardioidaceae bacterium]